jgi:16S rRNA (adenine1518-N6/adenine1519-N6)-dimethyltransferase
MPTHVHVPTRSEITELLSSNGLHPSRALGQNFVVDPNTVRRVVRLADVVPGQHVVEIGAGLGSLTIALVEAGAKVTALEVDRGILPVLRGIVEPLGVRVIDADALAVDWQALLGVRGAGDVASPPGASWSLVANLPYNIAVPVVLRALDEAGDIGSMLVMVQREVGERLAALPGDDLYGAVSVKVAYHAHATVVGRVPATVFLPRPKVESVLVRIDRRPAVAVDPDVVSHDRLLALVHAGFAQRRKMLRRSLAGLVTPEVFDAARVAPTSRAEELGVEDWGRLAAGLERRVERPR